MRRKTFRNCYGDKKLCRDYDDEENCVETMKMKCGLGVGCLFLLHISRGEIGLHSKQLQTHIRRLCHKRTVSVAHSRKSLGNSPSLLARSVRYVVTVNVPVVFMARDVIILLRANTLQAPLEGVDSHSPSLPSGTKCIHFVPLTRFPAGRSEVTLGGRGFLPPPTPPHPPYTALCTEQFRNQHRY
jgi:hypothetical protein